MLKLKMAPFAPDSLKRQQRRLFEFSRAFTKGQLISERLFDVLDFPKNQQKIWQISVLESK